MKRGKKIAAFFRRILLCLVFCCCVAVHLRGQQVSCPALEFELQNYVVGKNTDTLQVRFIVDEEVMPQLPPQVDLFINQQLAGLRIIWIHACDFESMSVEGSSTRIGILRFAVARNETGSTRVLYLHNMRQNRLSCILQETYDTNLDKITSYTVTPSGEINGGFPGCIMEVRLSGSQRGVSYSFSGGSPVQGTGQPIVLKGVLRDGVRNYVEATLGQTTKKMSGHVKMNYFSFLKGRYAGPNREILCPLEYTDDSSGCMKGHLQLPDFLFGSSGDITCFMTMLQMIDDGMSAFWHPAMRVFFDEGALHVICGPNIWGGAGKTGCIFLTSEDTRYGNVCLLVVQMLPEKHSLKKYTLEEHDVANSSTCALRLDGSQYCVDYRLYRDSVLVRTLSGTTRPLVFENLPGAGWYHAEAHYCDSVVQMEGRVYIDEGRGVKSYVREHVYTGKDERVSTTVFYDGLGRELQVCAEGAGQTIITPHMYDAMGREPRAYLPYGITGSGYRKHTVTEQDSFYRVRFGGEHYAFSDKVFDNSPRERVVEESLPGYATRLGGGHTVKSASRKNRLSDGVKRYVLSGTSLTLSGVYAAGTLMVASVTDGDGEAVLEYTDAAGQVVCKSRGGVSTYQVYDVTGQLRYIVPPVQDSLFTAGTKTLEELSEWCYYMEYDSRGRLYKQYVPGAGYTLMLYDKRDRLVLEQDALLRETGRWHFTKYDALDRPVIGGLCTGTEAAFKTRLAAQSVFGEERGNALHGYTNRCVPEDVESSGCLVIMYYDDYTWTGQSSVAFSPADTLDGWYMSRVQGEVTGTKTKVLGSDSEQWLLSAEYFDDRYRAIQSVSQLYPSGLEVVSNRYDFSGNVTRVKVKQTVGGKVNEYVKEVDYDDYGRLSASRMRITGDGNNGTVSLSSVSYDELGRAKETALHGGLERVIPVYDVRGRETGRRSSRFSYELGFESAGAGLGDLVTPRYNGVASRVTWGYGESPDRGYAYRYDTRGQLSSATYLQKSGTTWGKTMKYAERDICYDANGNLTRLKRTNSTGGMLHDIEYRYAHAGNGNAVSGVQVNGTSSGNFVYNAIGNLTSDGYRGVTITYNEVNLPLEINGPGGSVKYIYSAMGEKLAQRVGSTLTCYRGGAMVYDGDALSGILFPGGMVRKTNSGFVYSYFLTDHVGSTRVLLEASRVSLTPVQTTDYYPFGLAFAYNNLDRNKYLFSGKELQDATPGGEMLNLLDFGARFYDPILARWFCQDPALQLVTPYGYCGNNPVIFVDPDGEFLWVLIPVVIGAAINVVNNWDDIASAGGWKAVGKALGYAALGAGNGALSFYCPGWGSVVGESVMGMGNMLVRDGFNVDGKDFVTTGIVRGIAGGGGWFGGKALGKAVERGLSKLGTGIWVNKIASNVASSEVSGFTIDFGGNLVEKDWNVGKAFRQSTRVQNFVLNGIAGIGNGVLDVVHAKADLKNRNAMVTRQPVNQLDNVAMPSIPDVVSPGRTLLAIPDVSGPSFLSLSPIPEIKMSSGQSFTPLMRMINHRSIKIWLREGKTLKFKIVK